MMGKQPVAPSAVPCKFLKGTDKYGGSLENRALFALETIKKVREKVGAS